MPDSFDQPLEKRRRRFSYRPDAEATGIVAERIARFTGTPAFLIYLTVFVVIWIGWNALAPEHLRFDSASLGFTALTLMLSLQASYSAPLILLAQNRQDDRDRVTAENDRQRAERNLADTEFLTREIASLRIAMQDLATRDFVRSEIHDQLSQHTERESSEREDLRAQLADREAEIAALRERLSHFEDPGNGENISQ
ncbi:DUF1003 domain-containing protein [Trueperella sp. LYQ143]